MFKQDRKYEKLTPEAKEWLVACLDPYHDNQLRLEGLPDMVSAPSVVKMHNQSYTLTAPANAATDWDASVVFTGCNSEIGALPGLITNADNMDMKVDYDHAAFTTGTPFGSFLIKATVAGGTMTYGYPNVVDSTNLAFGACETTPNNDRCRIIGVAFEVTNTTAEIYKQGSVTVAMLPAPINDYNTVAYDDVNVAPWERTTYQAWYSPVLASTRDALVAVPGSQTWAAKEGVYAIPRMVTHTMSLESPAGNKRAAIVSHSAHLQTPFISCPIAAAPVGGVPVFNGIAASGFNGMQAFFSGLSHETSLTITMRTIVEYFPSFNSGLLQLTTPSPAFCPAAFEVYSRTAQVAPYAVPVKQNGAGEYFRKVLSIAGSIGSAVAPFLGPAGGVVGLAGSGATALAQYLGKRANEKKVAAGKAPALPPRPKQAPRVRRDEAGARAQPTRR